MFVCVFDHRPGRFGFARGGVVQRCLVHRIVKRVKRLVIEQLERITIVRGGFDRGRGRGRRALPALPASARR
jgi:hypothetical protein